MIRKGNYLKVSKEAGIDARDYDPVLKAFVTPTKQEFADECDINKILERYTPEALEERLAAAEGVYRDFSEDLTYEEARQLVSDCDDAFMSLPAKVRERFLNNPQMLIDFLDDPTNDEEAIKLGLKLPVQVDSSSVAKNSAESEKKEGAPLAT